MLGMILVAVLVFVGRFGRLLNLFIRRGGTSRTVNPARPQPPKNVAVANAHPDDLLLRPLRGTKQIVRDNGFKKLSHIDTVLVVFSRDHLADSREIPTDAFLVIRNFLVCWMRRMYTLQNTIDDIQVNLPQCPLVALAHELD